MSHFETRRPRGAAARSRFALWRGRRPDDCLLHMLVEWVLPGRWLLAFGPARAGLLLMALADPGPVVER